MTLTELRDKLREAEGPSRELDCAIAEVLRTHPEDYVRAIRHGEPMNFFWHSTNTKAAYWSCEYTSSIDAAEALRQSLTPTLVLVMSVHDDTAQVREWWFSDDDEICGDVGKPAPESLSRVLAVVEALIEKDNSK